MSRKNRGKKERHGEQPRSNEEERKPPPCAGSLVGGAAVSPGVSSDVATTDFQPQGVHGDLQKEGSQSDQRSVHCESLKSCPEQTTYDRTGRIAHQLRKEKSAEQHEDDASVAQTKKVSILQMKKGESKERDCFQTPTKEARLKEQDAGDSSPGQDEGASRQNEGSSQQHNEPETEEAWKTVQSRKSNRHPKGYSTRESSPCRSHRPLPGADNTPPHFRDPSRPYQKPSSHLHKKQGQEPSTQSEMDTEDQQRISEIKELIKRLGDRKDTHRQTSKDSIVSDFFQELAEQDFPRAFKEAHCVPPWLPLCVNTAQTTRPVQGRALYRQDSDVEGLRAECLVTRTFKALNASFAKNDQPAMFIIVKFCLDNLLGWLGPRGRAKLGDHFARLCTQIFGEDTCNQKDNERRETDLIVLHPDKGIIFVEVKAVGGKKESMNGGTIWTKIKTALKGLEKDMTILTNVMKRSPHRLGMKMQRVVALPNVTRQQLQQVTESKSRELKGVHFLCKDELLSVDDTKPDVENNLSSFLEWWHKLPSLQLGKESSGLKEIIGKYVGPLSSPVNPRDGNQLHQLRHISDCLRHAVRQHEKLLCDTQNEVLEKMAKSRLVYVEGPADRRSTSLLISKAHRYLHENDHHRVVVLRSLCGEVSRSFSSLIRDGHEASCVVDVEVNADRVKSADEVVTLIERCLKPTRRCRVKYETVLFVVDEIQPKSLRSLVLDGLKRIRTCKVWMACQASDAPEGFEKCSTDFTNCCPPSILQLLNHVNRLEEKKPIHHEKVDQAMTYYFGLSPVCVRHDKHDPKDKVTDCGVCARELADSLKAQRLLAPGPREKHLQSSLAAVSSCHELHPRSHSQAYGGARPKRPADVARCEAPPSSGKTLTDGRRQRPASEAQPAASCPSSNNIVPVVMFSRPVNHSDPDDSEYMDTCPFIMALRKEGVDVHVTRDLSGHDSDVAAPGMLVSCVDNFQGIEKAVVVFVPSERAVSQGAEQQEGRINTESSAPTVASMEWESADIRRFHFWDRTNMAVAASRCFGLFLLIVP